MQTLPDYVLSTRIVKWDGTIVKLSKADDPEGFKDKVVHFGLLGITVGKASFLLYWCRKAFHIKRKDHLCRRETQHVY